MEKARRYSPKREAILECLRSTDSHPAAEWVYAQLKPSIPDLSLATVYRNLGQFRKDGTIQVIGNVDGEERYDGDISPHSHFICRSCHLFDARFHVEIQCRTGPRMSKDLLDAFHVSTSA